MPTAGPWTGTEQIAAPLRPVSLTDAEDARVTVDTLVGVDVAPSGSADPLHPATTMRQAKSTAMSGSRIPTEGANRERNKLRGRQSLAFRAVGSTAIFTRYAVCSTALTYKTLNHEANGYD